MAIDRARANPVWLTVRKSHVEPVRGMGTASPHLDAYSPRKTERTCRTRLNTQSCSSDAWTCRSLPTQLQVAYAISF